MKILVTGASGFLGSHLVIQLLKAGFQVKAMVLPGEKLLSPYVGLKGNSIIENSWSHLENEVEVIKADVSHYGQVYRAMMDCHTVYHLANLSHLWISDKTQWQHVNVGGTQNVLKAAVDLKIKRFVFVSTAETLLDKLPGPYAQSKKMAEEFVLQTVRQEKLHAVIVHPTILIGPGDRYLSPPGQMILSFLNGKIKRYIDSKMNFVDVRDVATGLIKAAQHGGAGESYVLGGHNIQMRDYLLLLEKASGLKAPNKKISYTSAYIISWILEFISNYISKKPPLSSLEGLRAIKKSFNFDSQKAINQLGYTFHSIEDALKLSVLFYSL